MKNKWQRMLSMAVILTIIMTTVIFVAPTPALADGRSYGVELILGTRNESDAGTYGPVYASFGYEDPNGNRQYTQEQEIAPEGFTAGETKSYNLTYSGCSPWMIRTVRLHQTGGTGWAPGSIRLNLRNIGGGGAVSTNTETFPRTFWLYKGNYAEATFDANTIKRTPGSHGGYDGWNKTQYVTEESRGVSTLNWDGNVNDNRYGSYNVRSCDRTPTLKMSSSNSNITAAKFTPLSESTEAKFEYDEAELYKQMVANNLGRVDFNFSLKFDSGSTARDLEHNRTLTIYRRCFGLGGEDMSANNTFNERVTGSSAYNYYFNKDKKEVTIKLQPTTMHMEGITSQTKTELAKGFFCDASLYSGNNTTSDKLLCDMRKSNSNGVLTFTGTLPDNVDSLSDGVNLVLNNVYALHGEYAYKYSLDNGTTTFSRYFSEYKVDTKSPTISVVDVAGKTYEISNAY
ncbi:MAG: hypothetical protein RR145_01700, partial [Oscillospiraceae bacterium]